MFWWLLIKNHFNMRTIYAQVKYRWLLLFFISANIAFSQGSSGIFDSFVILNPNNTGNIFYELQIDNPTNPTFNGADLGTYEPSEVLLLNGGQVKTFKNGSHNVFNGILAYRVYETGSTNQPAFNDIFLGFQSETNNNFGGVDQVWEESFSSINLLSGLTPGNYTLEVFTKAEYEEFQNGPLQTHFVSDFGNNFSATFTIEEPVVEPDPNVIAYVWDDLNANGRQDNNEPALQDVSVELRKPGGAVIATKQTGLNGLVEFYTDEPRVKLKFLKKTANFAYTLKDEGTNDNKDSDARRNNGETDVFDVTGVVTSFDCGQWSPGTAIARVWDDLNANGRQDNGEPGIEGVNVTLKRSGGTPILSVLTDTNGDARFIAVVPSDTDVKLDFDLKNQDHAYTFMDQGNNDNKDSDARRNNGETDNFRTTGAGIIQSSYDCGQWSPGSAIAKVWDDLNANGRQDNNEPGIEGVNVVLKRSGGTPITSVITDANGDATFTAVIPADTGVKLDFELKDGNHAFTLKDQGTNDNKDSDARRNNGETDVFTTTGAGLIETSFDCGQWSPGSAVARVWDDLNANGRQDNNEPGIEGVNVALKRSGGNLITTVVTDANGDATFTAVIPADTGVKLDFELKDGDHAFTLKDQGTNDNKDSDARRNNGETDVFTTTGAGLIETSFDCGQWSPGTVESYVWSDLNGNGRQDNNEPGIAGVEVQLKRSGGTVIATTISNENGLATFQNVVPADTDVKLDFNLKSADYAFTYLDQGSNDNKDSDAKRNNGETDNFRTTGAGIIEKSLDCGQWAPGDITTYVWDDANNNGRQDSQEFGVPGVKVQVKRSGGTLITEGYTDVKGMVTLTNVPADAQVKLDYDIPAYAEAITTRDVGSNENKDSDAKPNNGETDVFTTVRGATTGNQLSFDITNLDCGLTGLDYELDTDDDGIPDFLDKYPTDDTNGGNPAIYSYVWDDLDGNGRQNDGQTGIGCVDVRLRRSGNNNVLDANQTHPANGHVAFFDIVAGTNMYLEYIKPENHAIGLQDQGSNDNTDSDAARNNGRTDSFSLSGSEIATKWDAALWAPGSVVAYVWDDLDGNGRQNENPTTPIKDVVVKLRRSGNNNVISTKRTNNRGEVKFNNLVPADTNVYLEFELPQDHAFTNPNLGSNESTDSDAARNNGRTEPFKTNRGSHLITDQDAGLWAPGSVVAYIWDDLDGNGRQNDGDTGIANVEVKLRRSGNNNVLDTQVTGANGKVTLTGVPADTNVYLEFVLPQDHAFANPNEGSNEGTDSDAARNNGRTEPFKTNRGSQVITDQDAGLWAPGSVVAYVWDDLDGNGRQNDGNTGIANVEVKLRRSGNNNVLDTQVTGPNGEVTLNGVPADTNVYLEFVLPQDHAFTNPNQGSNDITDSDAARNNGRTDPFRTDRGSQVVTDQDAGLWAPGSVVAYVWDDLDGNGRQNDGDTGIANIEVKLRRSGNNNVLDTQFTGSNGEVTLTGVPADTNVYLEFVLPQDHAFTNPNQGSNDSTDSDAARNNGRTDVFKTNRGSEVVIDQDAGLWSPGSVIAYAWEDSDGNGRQNESTPIEGIEVKLRRSGNNNVLDTGMTNADGEVTLNGVPADTNVYLEFARPNGATFTTLDSGSNDNVDSDAQLSNGRTAVFSTNRGGQVVTNFDAGYIGGIQEQALSVSRYDDVLGEDDIKMYPVPARDILNVNINSSSSINTTYSIISLDGRRVGQNSISLMGKDNTIQLDVSRLAPGQYYFNINVDGKIISKSFIKVSR